MRKLITLFMITGVVGLTTAQNVVFDGPDLENALLSHTPAIDTDGDGVISVVEAQAFTGTLDVSNANLTNHVGLEEFVNITGLDISYNNLTSLNVSANNKLVNLYCQNQGYSPGSQGILTTLTWGSQPNLKIVNANGNALSTMSLFGAQNIEELYLNSNSFNGFNIFFDANSLKHLDIGNDIAGQNNLYFLNITNSPLETLILSGNSNFDNFVGLESTPTLKKLLADGCSLVALDLSSNTNLEELDVHNNPNLKKLVLKNGNNDPTLATVNATQCPNLACIEVDDVDYSTNNAGWQKDSATTYNTDCPNPCTPISGLTVNSVQAGTALISWTPGGDETFWRVQYGPQGFTPDDNEGISTQTNNNYQISGSMTPNTTYDVYVRANCGFGMLSDWGTPQTFTTSSTCEESSVVVNSVTSVFSQFSIIPGDSSQNWWEYKVGLAGFDPNGNDAVYGVGTSSTNIIVTNLMGNTAYDIYVQTSCGSGIYSGWSTVVSFTVPDCEDVTAISATNVTSFGADISWTAGGSETMWNIEYGPTGFATGDGTTGFFVLTPGTPTIQYSMTGLTPATTYDVRIQAHCSFVNRGDWVNYTFTTADPCDDITALSVSNIGDTSADISWTAGDSEISWDILYGPQGFSQASDIGTLITVTTNPYSLTGLIEGYSYDIYVRSNCGGGSIGNWVQESFSTTGTPCIVNIPDANFKAYLLSNTTINTNNDTKIQCHEAAAISGFLFPSYQDISDLTGIEAFVNITGLVVDNNDLTSLDLSQNTKLTFMSCSDNNLTSLDVSQNVALTNLNCANNQIETLDLSNNTALLSLFCINNDLTHLNVKNGINTVMGMFGLNATGNPDLNCVEVDDVDWSDENWVNSVDNSGVFSEDCYTVSIEDVVITPMKVRLYPNPFSDVITITSGQNLIESVKVYDLKGVLLYQSSDKSAEVNLNLSNLSSGIYLVKTASQNGETMHKVVKR